MTADTAGQYLKSLRTSGLVAAERLDEALARFQHQYQRPPLAEELGAMLVNQGLLTPWQQGKLARGRSKGFFLGNYKLLQPLGAGGMARVYLAEQTRLKRQVAIKILPPEFLKTHASYAERFLREARAVARLDHPNIVAAYEAEVPPIDEQGRASGKRPSAYLVLQYIEGVDLHRLVATQGLVQERVAADYIRQAAEGLHHAHTRGLIHRDIKPANLMVDSAGVVKVMDLGLASLREAFDGAVTQKHQERLLGTPDFMSPEQASGQTDVDGRADVYSLGCTLYFLLCGRPPFPSGSIAERLMKHREDDPPPLCMFRADADPALQEILSRMMAKDPDDRFDSAAELAETLATWLAGGQPAKRRPAPRTKAVVRAKAAGPAVPRPDLEDDTIEMASESDTVERVAGLRVRASSQVGAGLGAWKSRRKRNNSQTTMMLAGMAAGAIVLGALLLLLAQ